MGEVIDLFAKIKKYYKFSPAELRSLIVTIVIFAFIISFREWGIGAEINIGLGLFNLFNALLIVTLSVLVKQSVHRVTALTASYRAEYKLWSFGILIALVCVFLTNGKLWFLIPGSIMIHHLAGHRLGWFRYGINYWALGLISLWGPVALMLLAIFFKVLYLIYPNPLVYKAFLFNLVFAVWSMIPIPPADGSRIFYGSRLLFIFTFSTICVAAALLYLVQNIWIAVFGSLIVGIVFWLMYYIGIEKDIWQGPYANMKYSYKK